MASETSASADAKLSSVVYGHTVSLLEEENALLRKTINHLKDDLDRMRRSPLMVCEVMTAKGEGAIIKMPNGNKFLVEVAPDCGKLRPSDLVFVEQKNLSVVRKANIARKAIIERFIVVEKPNVSWNDIGGLGDQIREMREIVELPMTRPELFREVGIEPPKGVLLYGSPGTGKTLLAKAVATATKATFIKVVGSELVQKFIGEGAKLVKEIFQVARERSPSIIFIDELDALAAKRVELGTSGEREVQRTFMQLLAEMDGFDGLGNVKVIGCTNRKDILDPAMTRPGRLERHIYFPLPEREARADIIRIHTRPMNIGKVDFQKLVSITEEMTGADIRAVCTEAGYIVIREGRRVVETRDFVLAVENINSKNNDMEESREYAAMFG